MSQPRVIISDRVFDSDSKMGEWLKDIGVELHNVRRVIIDLTVCEPARIYVEQYGDERLPQVGLPPYLMQGVEKEGSDGEGTIHVEPEV